MIVSKKILLVYLERQLDSSHDHGISLIQLATVVRTSQHATVSLQTTLVAPQEVSVDSMIA